MRIPIFFKIVTISLLFSMLSLGLFTVSFATPGGFTPAYFLYMLIIILGISLFVAGSITEPLERLKHGFEKIMSGGNARVEITTGDEFQDLAQAFNHMAQELARQREMLKRSEEKYRLLIEDINDWVFELDENWTYTYSSPKVREILGYEPEEVLGKTPVDLMPEEERAVAAKRIEEIRRRGTAFSGQENTFLRKDGTPVVLETSGRPFFDSSGRLKGYRAVSRDITARKRAEERLAYLAGIAEHSVDAIISLDLEGRIVSWNKGAEMMFGYTEREVLGKLMHTIMPRELWNSCGENFKRAIMNGYARDIETVRLAKDGSRVLVDQTLTTIYNPKGELIGFVAIMRDITKRKEAEEELKRAYMELEKKTKELLRSQKELKYLANIVENSNDAIYSVNLDGTITSWNKTAEKMFGWRKEEAIGMPSHRLLPEEIKNETSFLLQKVREGVKFISYETKRMCKDGTIVDVDVTVSPILDEMGNPAGFSVIARDISSKVKAEEGMLRRILKYDVSRGRVYLIEEPSPNLAEDVLLDLMKCGYSGTIITRRLAEEVGIAGVTWYWLSEKRGKNTVSPDVRAVEAAIMNLPNWNNAVLLELDYLILKNGFRRVFEFVQRIKEAFYFLKKGVLLLSLDPEVLSRKQLRLLKKECCTIRPKREELPPEIFEILRYVYMENRVGRRPSIKEVMHKFGIARNTAKKRIRYLEGKELVKVDRVGRLKLLEVTEKGRELFY
ncbi:MAG: PAS domain S-box protein [Euryarchaeota archaeon]|nr:PAS domain S-box protein [Euryarchaeota archaeon]